MEEARDSSDYFSFKLVTIKDVTAYQVSVFTVFLVPIQSEYGKIPMRKTPNKDTFCAVFLAGNTSFRRFKNYSKR